MRYVYVMLSLFFAFGILHAGTVSLTGTCTHALGSNTVAFGLANSGNDSAYSVHVLPSVEGAELANYTYYLGTVGPKHSVSTYVNLTNVTAIGTYADYFTVEYQQGSQVFVALFPCLLDFKVPADSNIILSYNITYAGDEDTIAITALNAGGSAINATLYPVLPPAFLFVSDSSAHVHMEPLMSSVARFTVKPEGSGAAYSGAVASSYSTSGIHYASLSTLVISEKSSSSNLTLIFMLGSTVVVVIMLLLILRVVLRRAAHKKAR